MVLQYQISSLANNYLTSGVEKPNLVSILREVSEKCPTLYKHFEDALDNIPHQTTMAICKCEEPSYYCHAHISRANSNMNSSPPKYKHQHIFWESCKIIYLLQILIPLSLFRFTIPQNTRKPDLIPFQL